jgi:DNA invertase Pin-like site-specific DNA recombinase
MKRAVLYLRVSTLDQTTANQERELRDVAGRMGCEIVKVYKDHGEGAEGVKYELFNEIGSVVLLGRTLSRVL